jgi:5'-phosphate synthase pdxT subunit
MRVGVLALQGAYAAHESPLAALGHTAVQVRTAAELDAIDGLVLPGGESSVQLALIDRFGIASPLVAFARSGRPILAVCAGLILAARDVTSPEQKSFGFIDLGVKRNAYGRQMDSFEALSDDGKVPLVFIRAPRITRVGAGVEVLTTLRGEPILVREGCVTGAAFHPELTRDVSVHRAAFGCNSTTASVSRCQIDHRSAVAPTQTDRTGAT